MTHLKGTNQLDLRPADLGLPSGYRDPMTYKRLPTLDGLTLLDHVLTLRSLQNRFANEHTHQYLHELMQGKDPRKSAWFKKAYPNGEPI